VTSAKDDEPRFVKDHYRKALRLGFLAILMGVVLEVIAGLFPTRSTFWYALGLSGLVPLAAFGVWWYRALKSVRAWREAWLKEHQRRNKEDSEHR